MGSYSRRIRWFQTPKFGLSIDIMNSDLLEIAPFSCAKNETDTSNSSRCLADSICVFFYQLHMRKQNTKSAVPLDAVPKRRIERCSTRFRSGDRFWSQVSDTCHQKVREKNVGPYKSYATDPSLPHTSIHK